MPLTDIRTDHATRHSASNKQLNIKEVIFIDQGIEDYQILIDGARPGVPVHLLDCQSDGVIQLSEVLRQYSRLEAIHIVSHGDIGCLTLGNSLLSTATLSQYRHNLFSWQASFKQGADILIYGCNVGKGIAGEYFVRQLADITGANIAASSSLTGNKEHGGNWTLDVTTNEILADFVFRKESLVRFSSTLATNTLDFSTYTITDFVTATHSTTDFGIISFKLVNNEDSTGTANASLTLAATGEFDNSLDDLFYTGTDGEYLVIYTDGREVDFQSVGFASAAMGGDAYISLTGYAYKDGVLLGNQTITSSGPTFPDNGIAETATFTDAVFENADEIRLIGNNANALSGLDEFSKALIDNLIIADPVTGPTITSATYNANTHTLVVTGTSILATGGADNDIDVSKLTLTGEDGTYTLTSSNVEIDSATQFTVVLNAVDQINVEGLLNKNGTSSVGAVTYNIAAAANWNPAQAGNADLTDNGITVSNVQTPTITSATYDANTGVLTVTGTHLVKASGATNDITANKFTFTGEGGNTYTLTDTANVEITDGTSFSITLSATDKAIINQYINKNGTSSTNGTTYNLAAADDWNTVIGNTNISDTTGITVSNVAVPAITSATYDANSGALVVTGTNFLQLNGAANDIVANKFTFTGEGGEYTLTDTANVDITSGTAFTITLSATDKAAINQIVNKNGTASTSGTTYNLAAAEDWAAGADAAVVVADTVGNGITASNVAVPAITSATYNYSTNTLIVTGTGFLKQAGATNDIDVSKFTFTGEGSTTYTLTSASDVEIDSDTQFTIILSGADLLSVEVLLNKNGISAADGTTYNLAAEEDWAAGADAAVNVVDATNGITVSNYAAPTITSAIYDASTGQLVITGDNFVSLAGASNDLDVSLLTLTGEGGSYTLTDTADVDITSATSATLTLSAADQLNVHGLLNKNGTVSGGAITYNLAAADNWMAGAPVADDISDTAGNGITVSNAQTPTITSATYDAETGTLVVTGTHLFKKPGAGNDIDISTLTFTGGVADATYTLTSASDVEITSATSFSVILAGADKTNIDALLDQSGTISSGGSTYNLAAADDWLAAADTAIDISDAVNAITVSSNPKITSATYDASTGILVVTGTNIQANGSGDDIDVSRLTFTGEDGATHTLTDTTDVERDSLSQFTVTLSATDKAAVNQILNKSGTVSTSGTNYNLAAADDWNTNVTAGDTSDTSGNGITVSNIPAPAITAATYNTGGGVLTVTGAGFLKFAGANNDIDASLFTFTGLGGGTYTLTDTADVDITSATVFTLILSTTDKTAVNILLNASGTAASDATTYNLAAAEDWATGSDAAVIVADTANNSITVTTPAPSGGGGGGSNGGGNNGGGGNGGNTGGTTKTVDGVTIRTKTETNGSITLTVPVIGDTRIDDPDTPHATHADIPVLIDDSGDSVLIVGLPAGTGLTANGPSTPMNTQDAANNLAQRIAQVTTTDSDTLLEMTTHGQNFLAALTAQEDVSIQTLTLKADNNHVPGLPIIITGPALPGDSKLVLIIDASQLPPGTIIQLDNVAFAVVTGAVSVIGGAGDNFVVLNEQKQTVILGAGDDILFGGAGDDTIGSLGGDDQVTGGSGDDIVYGGAGHDILTGGSGNDALNGGLGFDTAIQTGALTDYQIKTNGHHLTLTHHNGDVDTLTDIEIVRFETGPSLAVAHSVAEAAAHHLVKTWLGRDLTVAEGSAVQDWTSAGSSDIVHAFLNLPEASDFRNMTPEELLSGMDDNPNIIQLNTVREVTGNDNDNQGYLPLGLALHIDGRGGHDVLRMRGGREDIHLEQIDSSIEITRLKDGAMFRLDNAEMIAFDSGENILLAHNQVEGILGRLFQTFFDRDATIDEWQLGRGALTHGIDPDIILDWFQTRADLNTLNDTDYIQALYMQTFGRTATETELHTQQSRLENDKITREWLAVDIAGSDEAITTIGSVLLLDGGL
ncbi:MAG: DUF4347 domain-containing protein [Nitrosomonas sp.]|nr:DUF4347 domain-containing protein [Nitrosomonas sp.]